MIGFKLDPWQKEFIACKGDKILCCGRQVGKTEICAIDASEWAVNPTNKGCVLMTAPTERQAFNLFEKTLSYLMNNHRNLIVMGKARPTKTKIELKNGVKIYCLPVGSSGLGIRGLTVGRSYEDENARTPAEVEAAIAPMLLTTGGSRIKLSTPYGATGEFYNTWINKEGAYDSYTRFSITSETVIENREICPSWTEQAREGALRLIAQAKVRMSKREYAQEFLGEFMEDLHRFFSDEIIKKCATGKRREHIHKDREYFMGCDIARMGEDEGTFEIIDKIGKDKLIQIENIVTTKKLTTETEQRIVDLDKLYDFRKVFIDAGAGTLGVSVLDHLLVIDELKRKVVAIDNAQRVLNRDGDRRSKILKEDLYSNLLALMEQGRIQLLDDEDLIESFRSVQYEYVMKDGQPTRLRIFGNYTHIVEGIIRAAWCVQYKDLNIWITSF